MNMPEGYNNARVLDPRRIEIVDRASAAIMAQMTGGERLRRAFAMGDAIRRSLRHYLQTEHPEWNENQIRRELARRAGHGVLWAQYETALQISAGERSLTVRRVDAPRKFGG